jgi:hypothetical protein
VITMTVHNCAHVVRSYQQPLGPEVRIALSTQPYGNRRYAHGTS